LNNIEERNEEENLWKFSSNDLKNILTKYFNNDEIEKFYYYIIDKNSEQFKPFLYHATVYNKWIETLELPNGIIKIKYDVNVEGKIIFKQELIKVIQINKFFTIPDECDYTKSPK
jgi:GMP synthase PP-ATPase subunit